MKQRLIALLGNNISPAIAASAVGCSESYVSQLLSDEAVAEEVNALRFTNLQAASTRDRKADSLEDSLLQKIEEVLPMMMRPAELLRAYSIVNAAKRRGASAPEQVHINNEVIHLHMPAHIAIQFQLSSAKEITEVAGRELITMPSSQLLIEAKNHASNKLSSTATDSGAKIKQAA